MKRRRILNQTRAESSSIRFAKQRNASIRVELKDKLRALEDEKASIVAKYQRRERALNQRLADVGYTRSMPLLLLNMVHLQRRLTSHDVSMNVANCYLMHQEKAMQGKLKAVAESGGGEAGGDGAAVPKNLDRQALRHARFVKNAFEEAYNITADVDWTYGYDRGADIYEYGRTGHDLRCASVKDAPVGVKTGAYPQFKAVNVAAYDGRTVEEAPKATRVSVKAPLPTKQEESRPSQPLRGKQPPSKENQPTKAGQRARPPSAARPRLVLYMPKKSDRGK